MCMCIYVCKYFCTPLCCMLSPVTYVRVMLLEQDYKVIINFDSSTDC